MATDGNSGNHEQGEKGENQGMRRTVRMATFNALFKRPLTFHSFGDITFGRGIPWPQMAGFVVTFVFCWYVVAGKLLGWELVDSLGLSTIVAAGVTVGISHLALFGRNPFLELAAVIRQISGPRYHLGMQSIKRIPLIGGILPSAEERRVREMIAKEKRIGRVGRTSAVEQVADELVATGQSVYRNHRKRKAAREN